MDGLEHVAIKDDPAAPEARLLHRCLLALVAVGIAWRVARYLLCFPVWGDEAFNCLNLMGQDYLGLTGPLLCKQVGPLLFWWGELTALHQLGSSELALRLLPLLAGIGGLLLVWRLAHLTLAPLARTLAVGFLAVASWPVAMSTLIKPYSFDLCVAAGLLVLAVQWYQRPDRLRWLVLLTLAAPLAPLCSLPSVFVAGSVSLALLPTAWRQRGWAARGLFVAYNLLLGAGFLGAYFLSQAQMDHDTRLHAFLLEYWAHGFPPAAPLAFLKWFVMIHTGRMMAYPLGGSGGLSALTFILFLVGLWQWRRRRQPGLLVLWLGPFLLSFVAAVPRCYPYGGCCRLAQHQAPVVCLLAGAGAAALIARARSAVIRRRWVLAVGSLLVALGLAGTVRDAVHPYRGEGDRWVRDIVRQIRQRSRPGDRLVVLNPITTTDVVYVWELTRFPGPVGWQGTLELDRPESAHRIWCLNINGAGQGLNRIREQLARCPGPWVPASYVPYTLVPRNKDEITYRCEVYCWVRQGEPDELPVLLCRP